MHVPDKTIVTAQTKKWIAEVVIGCNFCPFASREFMRETIRYEVLYMASLKVILSTVMKMFHQLDVDENTETSFLVLPGSFKSFDAYLQLVELTETLLEKENYEGIYQVAGFHPEYLFAGSNAEDPSNYTNRSPYPMLHFLREKSVGKAVDNYPAINQLTESNIAFTKEKGLKYMVGLLTECRKS